MPEQATQGIIAPCSLGEGDQLVRMFLSCSSRNYSDAAPLVEALKRDNEVFFAPDSIPLGAYWQPVLAEEIARSEAFVLLVAGDVPGDWQMPEYYAASDRKVKDRNYPLIPVILGGDTTQFPFLALIDWLVVEPPLGEAAAARINAALRTGVRSVAPPWRHVNPFRDLQALGEADADLFFGRDDQIDAALRKIAEQPRKALVLVGNSGVGKSSLAQAGIVPRLRSARQGNGSPWPLTLKESPGWLYLSMKPGDDPVRALSDAFLSEWGLDPTAPDDARKRREWAEGLKGGSLSVADLVAASKARWKQLDRGLPAGVFLYLDQGEELYTAELDASRRFSAVIAEAVGAGNIRMLMSLRSDHYGFLQGDEALFPHVETLDVAPMSQTQLGGVMRSAANALRAQFAKDDLPERIAEAAAGQPGAMPILSVYLTQLWREMQQAGDGVLRLTEIGQGIEIASVLKARADGYFNEIPPRQEAIRRLFVDNLVRVPRAGPALRRRAVLEDLAPPLSRIAEELAGSDYRLLTTGEEAGKPVVEVAHEALFTAWPSLKDWIAENREFLEWKDAVEHDRKVYDATPKGANLLMGGRLAIARDRLKKARDLIGKSEQTFIRRSIWRSRGRAAALWGGVTAGCVLFMSVTGYFYGLQAKMIKLVIYAEQRYSAAMEERKHALRTAQINEAHLLADKAEQLLADGEALKAVLVALEGVPQGAATRGDQAGTLEEAEGFIDRLIRNHLADHEQYEEPVVPDVLEILARAYDSLVSPMGENMPHEDAAWSRRRVADESWPVFVAKVRASVPACLTNAERAKIGMPPRDDTADNPNYCRKG